LDFLLTGFLFLLLVALIGPLLVFAMRPDTFNQIPILLKKIVPAASQPSDSHPPASPTKPPTAKPTVGHVNALPRSASFALDDSAVRRSTVASEEAAR
jgi:hypothetical protein